MKTIELLINGTAHEVSIEPDESLLQVLRNRLDLTGTKKGCDSGGCGCCSVHVDGKVVYSCMMYAVAPPAKPSPPSRAWAVATRRCTRCSRRSSTPAPSSAAIAPAA